MMDMTIDFGIPAVRWIVLGGFFLVGASLGSFLNVCFWRIPRGESIVTTPSHCTTCHHKIAWFDNLPIASYLVLRGKCRYCHTPYSPRYFFVELATATLFALFAATGIFYSWTPREWLIPGGAAIYFALAIGWFDFRYLVIPPGVTQTALATGIVLSGIFPFVQSATQWDEAMLLSAMSGIGFFLALSLFAKLGKCLCHREIFGGGDIKAVAAAAALLGWKGGFFVLLAASLIGVVSGVVLAKMRHKKLRRQSVTFGVDLAIGILVWCFGKGWIVALPCFYALR